MVGPFDTYFLESDFVSGPWAYVAYIPQFVRFYANHPAHKKSHAPKYSNPNPSHTPP